MRTELKYIVPVSALPALREEIEPFVQLDPHCVPYRERGYPVRSIYLDSPDLRYYAEKQSHLRDRKKIRIRGYNNAAEDPVVFLEIKRKMDSAVHKERAPLRYADLDRFFSCSRYEHLRTELPGHADAPAVGRRVLYHTHRDRLGPVNLVAYEREAFEGRFDRTFRVTFDRNLRGSMYPGLGGLFSDSGFREALSDHFIMEVKFRTRFPAWMQTVVARFHLMQRAASKYCICLDLFDRRYDGKIASLANALPVQMNAAPAEWINQKST